MHAPAEEWHLPTRRLGRRVLHYDRLDSTNRLAAELAHDPAHEGLVVLAREQTAGRGQQGRSWTCPPGAGVLLSVLLFPPPPLRRPPLLTAWAAVSVCETIRLVCGLDSRIKWPNDVLIQDRKVCGILIEQRWAGGALATVAGIGLNLHQSPESLAADNLPLAASLACFGPVPPSAREVAELLIHQLDEQYDRLCQGDLATLEAVWKRRLGLVGRQVLVYCPEPLAGRLRDLSFNALELETPDAALRRLAPEQVQHVHAVAP
jgi:BirA family biotin operon repressor/biotin-[acetyl-CoA-carboxylase] ligase